MSSTHARAAPGGTTGGAGPRPLTFVFYRHTSSATRPTEVVTPNISEYETGRVYFIVSSKHGEATLAIDHYPARQSLLLPVFPSSAVEDALPYLDFAARHYAAQWRKIMVSNLDRDARGFSLPGEHLPRGIAPSENADELLAIARGYVAGAPEGEAWLADPDARVLWENTAIYESNKWQFAHEAEVLNEYDIALIGNG